MKEVKDSSTNVKLTMLGTGDAMAIHCYNTCFTLQNGTEYFLTDAGGGNGILVQIEKAGIPYTAIKAIFVTHAHTDHVLGVIWILRKIASFMSEGQYNGKFTIYCHKELMDLITTLCQMTHPPKVMEYLNHSILFQEITDGYTCESIGIKFHFFDIHSTKIKQFGFQATLPNGQLVACLGDEPYHEQSKQYVENCDWLLCEAFCLDKDKEIYKSYEKHHSTVLDAAKQADQLGIKNLVLYHTEDNNLKERKVAYTKEAASVFKGNIYVPDDLETIMESVRT